MTQSLFNMTPEQVKAISGKIGEIMIDLDNQDKKMQGAQAAVAPAFTGNAGTEFSNAMGRWMQVYLQMRTELEQIKLKVDAGVVQTQGTDDSNLQIAQTIAPV